jgi:glycine/D-amino acid oxidase-like deaminating enzyme/nitrite reductase/ring-hydroxylating ferredoxin subunit
MVNFGSKVFWQGKPRESYPALHGDLDADVVVIGGGITGLTAAYLLSSNLKVVVLEQNGIGSGTTGNSSAHLTWVYDGRFHKIIDQHGLHTAWLLRRSMVEAIDLIEEIVNKEKIACGFARVPGFLYAEPGQSGDEVTKERDAIKAIQGTVLDVTDIGLPVEVKSALRVDDQAIFNPGAYVEGLASACMGRSPGFARIFENTSVTNIDYSRDELAVHTPEGTVTAKKVIVATHTPLGVDPSQLEVVALRSRILVFPHDGVRQDALWWDVAEPYHYTRTYSGLGGPKQLVIGGEDYHTGENPGNGSKLMNYVAERYGVVNVTHSWSAQFYESKDGLPIAGESASPFHPNTFVATGFAGNGLTLGPATAKTIATIIQDKGSLYFELFSPTRVSLERAMSALKTGAKTAQGLVHNLFSMPQIGEMENLRQNEGGIFRWKAQPLAVYRDETGRLHISSARCSHMKCIVSWNAAEKTFDCPCHGSRFDASGHRIEGPAFTDLTLSDEVVDRIVGAS